MKNITTSVTFRRLKEDVYIYRIRVKRYIQLRVRNAKADILLLVGKWHTYREIGWTTECGHPFCYYSYYNAASARTASAELVTPSLTAHQISIANELANDSLTLQIRNTVGCEDED